MLSGNILRKYIPIKYIGKDKIKHYKRTNKKRVFNPDVYTQVLEFCAKDDISTALPVKRDVKKLKKRRFQKKTLNDYLSKLYLKLMVENTELKVPFATLAKMRPAHYIQTNFINRKSSICTKHQSMALKLKMFKTHNKLIFIKNCTTNKNIQMTLIHIQSPSTITKNGKRSKSYASQNQVRKIKKKIKIVKQTKSKQDFEDQLSLQVL